MSSIKSAVIAAAGIGSRLGIGHPKCLIEIGGKSLLQHLIENLSDIEDLRIVTGFMASKVMEEAIKIRKDIVFVQNHAFRTTTTLTSYFIGAHGCTHNVLYMDADIYFTPNSFSQFLRKCEQSDAALLAVTKAKTQDCVYVKTNNDGNALEFSRTNRSDLEWANLAYLPFGALESKKISVFEHLGPLLPIRTQLIESYEVDTATDFAILQDHFNRQ